MLLSQQVSTMDLADITAVKVANYMELEENDVIERDINKASEKEESMRLLLLPCQIRKIENLIGLIAMFRYVIITLFLYLSKL